MNPVTPHTSANRRAWFTVDTENLPATRARVQPCTARSRIGGRCPKLTPNQAAAAEQLSDAREKSVQQIAGLLGVPRSTVYRHLDKTNTVARRPKETAGL
ncbi:helix-turn-helix domain-containing protein [Streptomyces sp. NPDC001795]|uniref:helix-turn-helix domain-containing protein n=1 Tax=unclassified Streptomyces TaxID=2593676 RepID=UPI00331908D4